MNATADDIGQQVIANATGVHRNLTPPVLYEHAVRAGEGRVLKGGSLAVQTGNRTGRSPQDKYVVRTANNAEEIWWGAHNQEMTVETFEHLKLRFLDYLRGKTLYLQDCMASQDPAHERRVRVITETAYHSLFGRTMFIPRDERGDETMDSDRPELTILHAPFLKLAREADGINSEAVVALNLETGVVLIAGTAYAGEMKKSVFTAMNYYLPLAGALSLHCSANLDPDSGKTALFFGLSGTGKTTLSTEPSRVLIGDDEHAWTTRGISNIEGGCYAKLIRLSPEAEPMIHATTSQFGTLLENVVFNEESREPDLDDDSTTENTRGTYPLSALANVCQERVAPHPSHVILLTADAFGVMPPMAQLTSSQAVYHFLSGYTSKLAGTETGIDEPEATFSPCFGAPFMALHPTVYAEILRDRLEATGAQTWLINTGWVGGAYGVGHRIAIYDTRRMVQAILDNELGDVEFRSDPFFGFGVPLICPGVDPHVLNPREQWPDSDAYDAECAALADLFHQNFEGFRLLVSSNVATAGP